MKVLTMLVLLLLPSSLMAQPSDSTKIKTGMYFNISAKGTRELIDLNEQLQAAGHVPLVETLFGTALGVTNRFADQNSYSTTYVSLLVGSDNSPDNSRSTTLFVWELGNTAHYDVIANPRWLVYPYLGTGLNYGRLTVSAIDPNGTFQNSLSNLSNTEVVQKKYGSDGLMLFGELGGGVERVLKLPGSYTYVGLSGGYRLSTQQPWILAGVKTFEESFGTQGWTVELKFRFEANPEANPNARRGLFRFFK